MGKRKARKKGGEIKSGKKNAGRWNVCSCGRGKG